MENDTKQFGTLYLVATPIGNLKDMSFRSVETLNSVDFILAEDTRHSIKLLNHYQISKKLVSYHEHNQYTKAESIVKDLMEGKNIALITDAGTPGISDPGSHLILQCQEHKIPYTIIPGPSAVINALVISGQNTNRFVFEGFLPMKKSDRLARFELLTNEVRTMIFYEAPHKLVQTLQDMREHFGDHRSISLVRELTKLHEEVIKMTIQEACEYYEKTEARGEFVLVVEGVSEELVKQKQVEQFENISVEEQLAHLLSTGIGKNEAIKQIAKERKLNKRELYLKFTQD